MSYHESRSSRETAQLDDTVNQGNGGTCPEFLTDEGIVFYSPHVFEPSLDQHHVPFGTESTLASVCNDVSGSRDWYGGEGSCFAQDPLTPESDHVVGNSMFGDMPDWLNSPLANTSITDCVGQSGYPYPLSPAQSIEEPPLLPPPTRSPKRSSRRIKCQCGKAFTKNNDLKRHRESVHSTHGPKYRCICGHAQPRKDNHRRHVNTCENPLKHPSYRCKCAAEHVDEQVHLDHVRQCRETFYGCAGRPKINNVVTL
ncbi:hypothetical protein F4805DRAFT_437026 [Annulohypoxylon moriforme]|nr:hypothetical protein F4805DRAFT_437026 [Annulohypoxylon moriforme]